MAESATEDAVGYLVKRVQLTLRRHCDAALRPTGVSMAQYAVLRALADHPEASASELARLCFVTRQSLGDLMSGLREAGLVRPADIPPRGRAQALQLSAEGRTRLGTADAAVAGVERAMVEGVSPASQERLRGLLIRCAENLEEE